MNDTVSLSVGLDYSDGFVQVCAIEDNERATVRVNRAVGNDWRELVEALRGKGRVRRVAIEACSGAADLAEELVAHAGWHVELAHPHYVAKLRGSPDKSDYGDARLLADLTRVGYLPRTWLPPAYLRDLRQLVGYRQQLVDQRRALKLRVGALLREQRVRVSVNGVVNGVANAHASASTSPSDSTSGSTRTARTTGVKLSRWTKGWLLFVRTTEQLSAHARWMVNQMLDQVIELDRRVAQAEQRLRTATTGDAVVARLLEQEGIGEVTAWVLRAFVGEFDRFRSGKQLSRYCGLTPRNASSGTTMADAGLIKAGNRILRATLVQAAHRLIRTRPRWIRLAESMRARGKPTAVIVAAVANRWLRRLFHEMKTTTTTATTTTTTTTTKESMNEKTSQRAPRCASR